MFVWNWSLLFFHVYYFLTRYRKLCFKWCGNNSREKALTLSPTGGSCYQCSCEIAWGWWVALTPFAPLWMRRMELYGRSFKGFPTVRNDYLWHSFSKVVFVYKPLTVLLCYSSSLLLQEMSWLSFWLTKRNPTLSPVWSYPWSKYWYSMVKQCKWPFFWKVHVRSHWEHGENCLCCGYCFDSTVQLPLELQFLDHFPDKSPDTFFIWFVWILWVRWQNLWHEFCCSCC